METWVAQLDTSLAIDLRVVRIESDRFGESDEDLVPLQKCLMGPNHREKHTHTQIGHKGGVAVNMFHPLPKVEAHTLLAFLQLEVGDREGEFVEDYQGFKVSCQLLLKKGRHMHLEASPVFFSGASCPAAKHLV